MLTTFFLVKTMPPLTGILLHYQLAPVLVEKNYVSDPQYLSPNSIGAFQTSELAWTSVSSISDFHVFSLDFLFL